MTRTPQAELHLVSAMVMGLDVEEAAIVRPSDLTDPHAQAIWQAGWELRDMGRPVTVVALEQQLRGLGWWEAVGLSGLCRFDSIHVSPWEIRDAAKAVRRSSQLRQIREVAGELADHAAKGEHDGDELLADYTHRLELLANGRSDERVSIGEAMRQRIELARSEAEGARHRIPTGLRTLDEELRGGWRPTWQVAIAAAKKIGKSAFALTTMRAAARAGHPVLLFSAEMEAVEQGERALAAESDVPVEAIDRGPSDTEWRSLLAAAERAERYPFEIVDRPVSVDRLVAIARRWRRSNRAKPGVIGIDYIQLVAADRQRGQSREEVVASISRRLKQLAAELKCVTIVVAQLLSSKIAARKDKRPTVDDIRETGAIADDANLVLLIHRPWVYDTTKPPAAAEVIVGASRVGPYPRTLPVIFAPKTTSFHDTETY